MRYRRSHAEGGTFFLTLATFGRRPFLYRPPNIALLRETFRHVIARHPFTVDAIVVLPDHLHSIWTLPAGDADFPLRCRLIKAAFTRGCDVALRGPVSASRRAKGEQAVWQRRYWEHQIRDEQDFARHVEYVHHNPVKHGYVTAPRAWPYSSFEHYVRAGQYDEDWGPGDEIVFPASVGHE